VRKNAEIVSAAPTAGALCGSDERYAPWPDVIQLQFFGGPSARHQFNGNTISSFLTDTNVMAIFLRAFGPQSIQWQYNFHFFYLTTMKWQFFLGLLPTINTILIFRYMPREN
jgi:hypothetical protein